MFRRGQSAKLRPALPEIIITIVVLIGLMVVFPLAFALPGAHLLTFARWQFAISVYFHILFPSIAVGTSILLCVLYGMYWNMQRPVYLQMFRFWRRVSAAGSAPAPSPASADATCPAATRAAYTPPAPWRHRPTCCSSTNRPPASTAAQALTCLWPSAADSRTLCSSYPCTSCRPTPAPYAALGPKCRSTKEVSRSSALNPVPPATALSADRCGDRACHLPRACTTVRSA
jgi:hypothetical protein